MGYYCISTVKNIHRDWWPAYKSNLKNICQKMTKISRLIREYIRYLRKNLSINWSAKPNISFLWHLYLRWSIMVLINKLMCQASYQSKMTNKIIGPLKMWRRTGNFVGKPKMVHDGRKVEKPMTSTHSKNSWNAADMNNQMIGQGCLPVKCFINFLSSCFNVWKIW